MHTHIILRIESFEGKDTYLRCGNDTQSHLFCVVRIENNGEAEIVDNGYRTYSEVCEAWPEARPAAG
ncbi:hypothetical protein HQ520_18410 [bacterium]|nr:hypothetical protein [bacterium]